jgi:hypothetical protein
MHFSWADERGGGIGSGEESMEFIKDGPEMDGYSIDSNGAKSKSPNVRATILPSGDIRWISSFDSCEMSDNKEDMKMVFTAPNGRNGDQTITWLLHKK